MCGACCAVLCCDVMCCGVMCCVSGGKKQPYYISLGEQPVIHMAGLYDVYEGGGGWGGGYVGECADWCVWRGVNVMFVGGEGGGGRGRHWDYLGTCMLTKAVLLGSQTTMT